MEVNSYVECINDNFKGSDKLKLNLPKKNMIYTVKHVKEIKGLPRAITLVEIDNDIIESTGDEPHFSIDKFKTLMFDIDPREMLDELLEGTNVHVQGEDDLSL